MLLLESAWPLLPWLDVCGWVELCPYDSTLLLSAVVCCSYSSLLVWFWQFFACLVLAELAALNPNMWIHVGTWVAWA
jgi:hypothetical protein